jgi:PPE family
MSGDVRWRGYTHQELYDAINSGPGAGASSAPASRWGAISTALGEIGDDLTNGLAASAAGWSGAAANRAYSGIAQLARWADEAHTSADYMRTSTEVQADYITKARSDMPPPVKVPRRGPSDLLSGLVQLFFGQIDAEIIEAAQDAAANRAFEVMSTYETNTAANTASLHGFQAPPQVVAPAVPSQRGEH